MIRRFVKKAVKKALGIDTPERASYENPPSAVSTPVAPVAPVPAPEVKEVDSGAGPEKPAAKKPAAKKPAAKKPAAKKPAAKKPAAKKPAAKTSSKAGPELQKAVPPIPEPTTSSAAGFTMDDVQEILDDMVRPALQGDGGDITLVKIEDNDVYVRLVGACNTCPSSIMTMKMGVEALLREEFPSMRELIQMDPGIPAI
jgi:Fe-S cluster biogenesis protein NfuA